jgi:hypothetical protein
MPPHATGDAMPPPRGAAISDTALIASFQKYSLISGDRSLTVAALIGAARVSKRFPDTLANF